MFWRVRARASFVTIPFRIVKVRCLQVEMDEKLLCVMIILLLTFSITYAGFINVTFSIAFQFDMTIFFEFIGKSFTVVAQSHVFPFFSLGMLLFYLKCPMLWTGSQKYSENYLVCFYDTQKMKN